MTIAPLVSIITPSFNQGEYIGDTIKSVRSQTYRNIEHLVIDGGSVDGTDEVIQSFEPKVSVYIREPDSGQAQAINKGFRLANGRYAMWLNSDDILLPHAVENIVKLFEMNPDIDFCHGKSIMFSSNKQTVIGADTYYEDKYCAYMSFPQPSSFFRLDALDKIGLLDEDLHFGMDFDFYLRLFLQGKALHYPCVLSKYRIHRRSKSNDGVSFMADWREVFSRFVNSYESLSELKQKLILWGLHSGTKKFYCARRIIDSSLLEKIVFNHFFISSHILYRYGKNAEVSKHLGFLKYFSPRLYYSRKAERLAFRAQFVPRSLRGLRDVMPR